MPAGGAGHVADDIKKGIQKVSATEFNVDRGVVDKILENQAELMRQARIVPEQENGKVVGIRLFGVRPDTLLGTLGMENGDRLQTINGFDMTSPEKALEAYARLRTADHLTVSAEPQGPGHEHRLQHQVRWARWPNRPRWTTGLSYDGRSSPPARWSGTCVLVVGGDHARRRR